MGMGLGQKVADVGLTGGLGLAFAEERGEEPATGLRRLREFVGGRAGGAGWGDDGFLVVGEWRGGAGGGQAHGQQHAVAHAHDQQEQQNRQRPQEKLQTHIAQPRAQTVGDQPLTKRAAGIGQKVEVGQKRQADARVAAISLEEAGCRDVEPRHPQHAEPEKPHPPMQEEAPPDRQKRQGKVTVSQAGKAVAKEGQPRAQLADSVGHLTIGRGRRVAEPRDVAPVIGEQGDERHRHIKQHRHAQKPSPPRQRGGRFGRGIGPRRAGRRCGRFGHGHSLSVTRENLVRLAARKMRTTSMILP